MTAREITDPAALKALTHPLRQRILRELRNGPATSATLAKALGENTGATSYHLRQLAAHGFIEEVPERAHGRERWWRSPWQDLRFPPHSRQSEQLRTVLAELHERVFEEDVALFRQAHRGVGEQGEWADAFAYSRGQVRITAARAREFFTDYLALLTRYADTTDEQPPAPGTRVVQARLLVFPDPEDEEAR
jgi:DNA-binding transcriptional ArsR family regulator